MKIYKKQIQEETAKIPGIPDKYSDAYNKLGIKGSPIDFFGVGPPMGKISTALTLGAAALSKHLEPKPQLTPDPPKSTENAMNPPPQQQLKPASTNVGMEPKTPSKDLSKQTPWKTDKFGKVAGTKLTPVQYNQYLSNKYGIESANKKIEKASGIKLPKIKPQTGITMKENYNQETLIDLMLEVDTILEEIDNPTIIMSQLNIVAEKYSLTNRELVEIMNEAVPRGLAKAASGILSKAAEKAADIYKGAIPSGEKAAEFMKKRFGIEPSLKDKNLAKDVKAGLGGGEIPPNKSGAVTSGGGGKDIIPRKGKEIANSGKGNAVTDYHPPKVEKEIKGQRIYDKKPEISAKPSQAASQASGKDGLLTTAAKYATGAAFGIGAADFVRDLMNKDDQKAVKASGEQKSATDSGTTKSSETSSAELSTSTPWKTDKSGKVTGTKLSPKEYNQYLEKKYGTELANKKIAQASGPGWKDFSKKIKTASIDTSVTQKYPDMPTVGQKK